MLSFKPHALLVTVSNKFIQNDWIYFVHSLTQLAYEFLFDLDLLIAVDH